MKIALLSDIHEDVESLKKALKLIELEKCDHIICLGDILGYPFMRAKYEKTKNASECIMLIKKYCSNIVLGNHDIFHLKKIPDYNNNYKFPNNWFDLKPEIHYKLSDEKIWKYTDDSNVNLSEKEIDFLSNLPEFLIKDYNDNKILFSHFLYPSFTGYISTGQNDQKKLDEHFVYLKQNNCELSFCGHMHIEGLGIAYEPDDNFLSKIFKGFMYFSYGEKKIKYKKCTITIPALADNSQVNGFAIYNDENQTVTSISLNPNRRFIL